MIEIVLEFFLGVSSVSFAYESLVVTLLNLLFLLDQLIISDIKSGLEVIFGLLVQAL